MKKLLLFVLLCTLSFGNEVVAQTTAKKYPEPEFINKPYYFDEAKNEVEDLQAGFLRSDTRTSGFSSEEEFYYEEGEKASKRIKKGAKTIFIVKLTTLNTDVNDYFTLMKLKYNPKKKRREVVTEQKSTFVNSKNAANVNIFYKVKDGQEIWYPEEHNFPKFYIRLLVVENLEPGEYVWKYGLQGASFFGIDE